MNSHELANWMLSMPDSTIEVSVDVSTEKQPYMRIFGEASSYQMSHETIMILCIEGEHNEDYEEVTND